MSNTKVVTAVSTVAAIGSIQLLQPFTMDMYLPSMMQISHDLGVGVSVIQLTISILGFGFAMGQLVAGPVSDSVGRRRPLFWALAIYVAASLVVWAAPSIFVYAPFRFLQGFAGSAMTVLSLAILRDLYQGLALIRASSRIAVVGASAWFIGPTTASLVLAFTNWRGMSLMIAAMGVLVAIFAWRTLPETKALGDRNSHVFRGMGHRFGAVLRDRGFQGYALISAAIGIGLFGYLGIIPQLYDHAYGLGGQVGYFIAINSFGAYLGIQVGARLAQRFAPQWVLTGGILLAALAGGYLVLIAGLHPNVWMVNAGLLVWTFVFGLTTTPIQALAFTPHGEEAGTAAAVIGFLGAMGPTLAGPYLTGLDKLTSAGMGSNIVICMAVSVLALLWFVRPWSLERLK